MMEKRGPCSISIGDELWKRLGESAHERGNGVPDAGAVIDMAVRNWVEAGRPALGDFPADDADSPKRGRQPFLLPSTIAAIESGRGHEVRSSFVRRLLHSTLADDGGSDE